MKTGRAHLFFPALLRLFSEQQDNIIHLREAATGKEIAVFWDGGMENVNAAAFSPDGRYAAIGCGGTGDPYKTRKGQDFGWTPTLGNRTLVWDLSCSCTVPLKMDLPTDGLYADSLLSADGKIVAGNKGDDLFLVDALTGKSLRKISRSDRGGILFPRISSDGHYAIYLDQQKAGVPLVDTITGKEVQRYRFDLNTDKKKNRQELGEALAFSPDSSAVFIAFMTGISKNRAPAYLRGLYMFDRVTGKMLRDFKCDRAVLSLCVSPDGKWLAGWRGPQGESWGARAEPREVAVWNVETGAEACSIPAQRPPNMAFAVAISPLGQLAIAEYNDVSLWNIPSGKSLYHLGSETVSAIGLAYAPDGKTLLVATQDCMISRWDAATGKLLRSVPFPKTSVGAIHFAFDESGRPSILIPTRMGASMFQPGL